MTHQFPSDLLKGRLAVITGGAGGIGTALSLGFSEMGADVVVAGFEQPGLDEVAEKIRAKGGSAWAELLDVTDPKSCADIAERVKSYGETSILVNNAGAIKYATLDSPEVQNAWDLTIGVNLGGPFNTVRAFLSQLKSTQGSVVNIASIAASIYTNNTVGYSASKGGVRSLTMAMARELGEHGIRVNAVAPGVVATGMAPSASDAERRKLIEKRIAIGRIAEPADMVGPVAFLASSMSSYVTGTTLVADGGYLTN